MSKNAKKVIYSKSPTSTKQTKQKIKPESYDTIRPSWRFFRGYESKYSIFYDAEIFVKKILPKLKDLEKSTWADIKSNGSHNISVSDFSPLFQTEYEKLRIDYDELFSLRLAGKERIFGVLSQGILEMIWYDAEHQVCISNKKHT